jgi:hypothetical protein
VSCKYCNQPTSSISQVCQRCLLSTYGSPYDREYIRAQRWHEKREAQWEAEKKTWTVQP